MMGICRFLLAKKEEVSLFDNGLRIESNLKILTNDNWQSRYVVCQRRCLSEAPLIGIFKNQRTREQNQHLELFYLQNYIGYEYGFKFKNSNKTLAILVQGQTLIFSFNNVESLVFWKEWLKDVCGRSALFFVRIYSAPKDNSIIKLTSRNARIHITRYALVIVQEIPPKQCLYLNLEDLSDVECVQNKFAFRALAYPWNHPQTFIFTSDQIPELTAKLQCLLKAKQYFNQQSNQVSRLSSLKNSSLGQTSTTQHPLQFFAAPSPIMYANDRGQQSPNTPMFTSMYANDNDEQRRSSDGSFEGDGPPPLKKKSFEEGPYAIPIELGGEPDDMDFEEEMQLHPVIRSRGGSRDHMRLEDFHFVSEGTPAQFLNQQLTTEQRNFAGMDAPPPGLVKPAAEMSFLSVGTKLRKSLSKKLKRHLAGSYSKYDGDKSSTSYPREQHAQNNSGSGCGGSQRKVRPRRSATPQSTSTTKLLANQPIMEDVPPPHQFPSRQPKMMTKQKATRNESFDSSISSTVRIDCAVQKGRERLKMSDRRSSTSASQRNSAVNSEKSSTNDLTVIENEGGENEEEEDEKEVKKGEVVDNEQDDDQALNAEAKSMSHSVSTLQISGTRQSQSSTIGEAGFDRSHYSGGSEAITALGLGTPMAVSLEELMDPDFKIKGPSAISLREKSPSLDSGEQRSSGGSQRSLSVCSELNSRILFQRGGRNRASGRSNKVATQITEVPLPPSLPPPLPPRKISSQHSMPKSLQLFKPNDDYADIDDVMFTANNDFNPIYSNEQQPPPNLPKISVMNNVDYVQICPIATTALKELSHQRGLAFKRSNSLYDILSLQPKNQQQQRKQQSSEAEYYCSIDWSSAAAQPRAFTSSTSYLTHVMSQTRKNLQKRGSASSSTNSLRILK